MRNRAYRRAQERKLKRKLRYSPYGCRRSDRIVGQMINHRPLCSCNLCGNPRRHYDEVTRQERIADIREREQTEAYYEEVNNVWR